MKLALFIVVWVSFAATVLSQGGAGVVDAKALAKIRAQESTVENNKSSLTAANRSLQDDYAHMQTLFLDTQTGASKDAVTDLGRVLENLLKKTNSSILSGRTTSKIKREFAKAAGKTADKVEHELLKAMIPQLREAFKAALAEHLQTEGKPLEADEFSRLVITKLLPKDVPFWKHWNETLLPLSTQREKYIAAFDTLKEAEQALLILKDAKMRFTIGAPLGMAKIPAGKIVIESTYGFSTKKRKAKIKDFYIDLYEVTHGDYWSKFWINLKDKELKTAYLPIFKDLRGRELPQWVQDPETGEYLPLKDRMNWPVTGIDVAAARAYAASQGKRLPTEAEWVAAATATPGKTSEYPWGAKWVSGSANDAKAKKNSPTAVGSFPLGRSFYGLHDVSGNVKEWLDTVVSGRNGPKSLKGSETFVVRGGSYDSSPSGASLRWRWQLPGLNTRQKDVGFRCAMDIK